MEKPPAPSDLKPKRNSLKIYAKYSAIGFQMAAIILIGLWGGKKIDLLLGNATPVFTITLTFISFAAALYYLFKGLLKKQ